MGEERKIKGNNKQYVHVEHTVVVHEDLESHVRVIIKKLRLVTYYILKVESRVSHNLTNSSGCSFLFFLF